MGQPPPRRELSAAHASAGVPHLSVPDLSILNTDFVTPMQNAVAGVTDQVTALTKGLGTLDCLAGVYGNPAAGVMLVADLCRPHSGPTRWYGRLHVSVDSA